MKIYLVKRVLLEVQENGRRESKYNGVIDDFHFSSKQKAYNWIKLFVEFPEEWEHRLFPYEIWTNKKEVYKHDGTKWYSRIELHQIEVK